MLLTVKEVSGILSVSEKTIYRWIKSSEIPALRVGEQYRFNRVELLEWANAKKIGVSATLFDEEEDAGRPALSVSAAISAGGIAYRLSGHDKESVLRAAVAAMHLPEAVDRDQLLLVLRARESLASTGVGNGIAIPHVRSPIVLHVTRPTLTLCFLENPVEFGAVDGRPVHALFMMVSPTVRAHLQLLSKLAFALQDARFRAVIERQGLREEIQAELRRLEDGLRPPPAVPPHG